MINQYQQSGDPVRGYEHLSNIFNFLRPGVELHYENNVRNDQIAPLYKGIDQTYLMSYYYRQSGNPIRSNEY